MNENKVLFLVNGLGLGNTTRSLAILEELKNYGLQAVVATFPQRQELFSAAGVRHIFSLVPLQYPKLNFLNLLWNIPRFFCLFLRHEWQVLKIIRSMRPKVIVYDSIFCLSPRLFSRAKILSINNSDRIIHAVLSSRKLPFSHWPQFLFVECLDFIFQRFIPHQVLSPWPKSGSQSHRKFIAIPPIVRRQVQAGGEGNATVYFSGGSRGADDLVAVTNLLGPAVLAAGRNNINAINSAKQLVVHAGFSSISEGMKRRVPIIAVPIPGHAEQWVNAQLVQDLGIGIALADGHRKDSSSLRRRVEKARKVCKSLHIPCDGAEKAAQVIRAALVE